MSTRFEANQIQLLNEIDNNDLSDVMVLTKEQISNEILEVETDIVTTAHNNLFTFKELYTTYNNLDEQTKNAIEASETSEIEYTNAEFKKLFDKDSENFYAISSSLNDKTDEVTSLLGNTSTQFETIENKFDNTKDFVNELDSNLDTALGEIDNQFKIEAIDIYISDISEKFYELDVDMNDIDDVRLDLSNEVYTFISDNTFVLDKSIDFVFDKYKQFSSELEDLSTDVVVTYDLHSDNIDILMSDTRYREEQLSDRIEEIVIGKTDKFSDIDNLFDLENQTDKQLFTNLSEQIYILDTVGRDNEQKLSNNIFVLDEQLNEDSKRINTEAAQFLLDNLNNNTTLTDEISKIESSNDNLDKFFFDVNEGTIKAEDSEAQILAVNNYLSLGTYWRLRASYQQLDIQFNKDPRLSNWETIPFVKNNTNDDALNYLINEDDNLDTLDNPIYHAVAKPSYEDVMNFLNSIQVPELRGEIWKLFTSLEYNLMVIPADALSLDNHPFLKPSNDTIEDLLQHIARSDSNLSLGTVKIVESLVNGDYPNPTNGEPKTANITEIVRILGNLMFIKLDPGSEDAIFDFNILDRIYYIIYAFEEDNPDLACIFFPFALNLISN